MDGHLARAERQDHGRRPAEPGRAADQVDEEDKRYRVNRLIGVPAT